MEEEQSVLDELDDLYTQDGMVEIGKHRFPVRHLQVMHAGVMFKAFRVACAMIGDDEHSEAILAAHAEDILPAVGLATGLPLDKLRKMRGGVQMRLWAAVLHVNEDFFFQFADHKFGGTADLVMRTAGSMDGLEPSTTSSSEGTPNAKRIPLAALRASSAPPT